MTETLIIVERRKDGRVDRFQYAVPAELDPEGFHGTVKLTLHAGQATNARIVEMSLPREALN